MNTTLTAAPTTTLAIHPVATLMPSMTAEEQAALRESIQTEGQIMPILVHDNQIIDGRHRYWACMELGITPVTAPWTGPTDTQGMIKATYALNAARRHLTISQRAALAAMAMPVLQEQAEERMLAGKPIDPVQKVAEGLGAENATGRAREVAAETFGVNHNYVDRACKIKDWDEGTFQEMAKGNITIADAGRKMQEAIAPKPTPQPKPTPTVTETPATPAVIPPPPLAWQANVLYTITSNDRIIRALYQDGAWTYPT